MSTLRHRVRFTSRNESGFILPTVLVLSLTIVTTMVALLMVTSASFGGNFIDHAQKMADEAAEAGAAYATACLSLSEHVQTWGSAKSKPDLKPNTDCNGTNSYPSNAYVFSNSQMRTYFVVGNLDYSYPFSAQVSSTGYTQLLRTNGTVEKTYTSVQKKIITWPTDISGQMSASGTNRTCAIVTSSVYCWGYNAYGQLGNGQYIGTGDRETASSVDSTIPVKVVQEPGVMEGKRIVKIFVAQFHSCALSDDGQMFCWGDNLYGQLGDGTTTLSAVPVRVGGALASKTITDIGGSGNTTCAIAEGKIYCWGQNHKGQLGLNSTGGTHTSPALVTAGNTSTTLPTSYTATALSTSGSRSFLMCAVADGKAYCWGQNDVGSVGNNTGSANATVNLPTKVYDSGVLSGKTVTSLSQDGYNTASGGSSGFAHVCAVASGSVYCWGDNSNGQLGDNSTTDRKAPVAVVATGSEVLSGKTVQEVQVGLRHSCARADGAVYCWGSNSSGQLGDGTSTQRNKPVTVSQQTGALTSSNVISIGAGANRGCAVVSDGRTFCWGLNTSGQIGDGTKINRNVPTESLFLRPVGNQYIF